MLSLSYVGALLTVAVLLSAPISAQTSAPASARVEHVVVRGTSAAMEVEIQTSGAPVAPDTQTITGPDRIVVDFPGALPAAELRALKVNLGVLKGVRSGLFFSNPPITRIVLDLVEPQSYQISTTRISTTQNAIVVKLSPVKPGPVTAAGAQAPKVSAAAGPRLQNASLAVGTNVPITRVATAATCDRHLCKRDAIHSRRESHARASVVRSAATDAGRDCHSGRRRAGRSSRRSGSGPGARCARIAPERLTLQFYFCRRRTQP